MSLDIETQLRISAECCEDEYLSEELSQAADEISYLRETLEEYSKRTRHVIQEMLINGAELGFDCPKDLEERIKEILGPEKNTQLKNCPFCASKAKFKKKKTAFFVKCTSCQVRLGPFFTKELAAENWNERRNS